MKGGEVHSLLTDRGETRGMKLHSDSPKLSVKMGGVDVISVCDTGSEVSMISSEIYNRYLKPKGVRLHPTKVKIRSVGGRLVSCRGCIAVDVVACGSTIKDVGDSL